MHEGPAPLQGLRVIELGDGASERCGRLLADLGAVVIKVEPPEGAASRSQPPLHGGVSLPFAIHNAGKRSVVVDLDRKEDQRRLRGLLAVADIWVCGAQGSQLAECGLDADSARALNPSLVVMSVTDFGQTGPYRDWVATDWTLLALGGVLGRSGLPGREPLMPPGSLALEVTAAQAAWAALLAYWNRLRTGAGDHIDFSLYEATVQTVEPALGTVGTAQIAGYEPTRGRPAPGPYPIFRCRDGFVRVVLLTARQWHAMRAWLGDPEELQVPALDTIRGRAQAAAQLHAAIERHFGDRDKHELAEDGQARGVPVAPVLSIAEVLAADHFRARGAIASVELADGLSTAVPVGWAEIDGRRAHAAGRAPGLGEHGGVLSGERRGAASPRGQSEGPQPRRPLEGLRVLDFGVIVFGAEAARLFCEQGAEVIKIESRAFPDGARVSPVSFAVGHRGSKSVGVNLRSPEGVEVVKRLVAQSDLLLANFKPGTLEKLGLGITVLRAINPRIVVVQSSAVGSSGPWSGWIGYGPLVRCLAGLSSLWRYPDDPESFSDSTVVHPDHYAARLSAIAALAALIVRERSARGASIAIAQAETILTQLAEFLAAEALSPGSIGGTGNVGPHSAPWGVYACAGDDEWCAITVRDDADWKRLRRALGDPAWAAEPAFATAAGRLARRRELDARLAAWTRGRGPREVAEILQAERVPAGFMQRGEEYERDRQLRARDFFATFEQPGLEPRTIERAPFRSQQIPLPALAPAPAPGEHTREVCGQVLGMSEQEIERLLAAGALEEPLGYGEDAADGAREVRAAHSPNTSAVAIPPA
jgi:crotonobetainyl-CoA:carnitine CoA-transferase CaiB-like acyl-CoA transferase